MNPKVESKCSILDADTEWCCETDCCAISCHSSCCYSFLSNFQQAFVKLLLVPFVRTIVITYNAIRLARLASRVMPNQLITDLLCIVLHSFRIWKIGIAYKWSLKNVSESTDCLNKLCHGRRLNDFVSRFFRVWMCVIECNETSNCTINRANHWKNLYIPYVTWCNWYSIKTQ